MKDFNISFKEYFEKIQELNDRRYAEVALEREKALRIKEDADEIALKLARDIQTYKDEQHNGLLKQWQLERGTYVTNDKFEAVIKPVVDFVASQQGKSQGLSSGWGFVVSAVVAIGIVVTIVLSLR